MPTFHVIDKKHTGVTMFNVKTANPTQQEAYMNTISINELKKSRKKLVDSGRLNDVRKAFRKGIAKPEEAILLSNPQKNEIARMLIGNEIFIVYWYENFEENSLRFGQIGFSNSQSYGTMKESEALDSTSEIIAHEGNWLFTRGGHHHGAMSLNLDGDDVAELAGFLGLVKRSNLSYVGRIKYSGKSGLSNLLKEWAENNHKLSKNIDFNIYENQMLAA